MVLHARRAASERPRRRNFTASLPLVTSQPSLSPISTLWYAVYVRNQPVTVRRLRAEERNYEVLQTA
jgi:hypothetical protein